jgi:hypothetical protein
MSVLLKLNVKGGLSKEVQIKIINCNANLEVLPQGRLEFGAQVTHLQ